MDQKGTQKAGSRVDPTVVTAIQEMALIRYSPSQIQQELSVLTRQGGSLAGRTPPSLKTIRRMLAERPASEIPPPVIPPANSSEPWSPAEDRTGSPGLVLDLLGMLLRRTSGAGIVVSHENAARFVNLARAVPDVPILEVWILTVQYDLRREAGQATTDLDGLLALAPWRDGPEGWAKYERLTTRTPQLELAERRNGRPIHTLPPAPSNIVARLRQVLDAPRARADGGS